MQRTLAWGGVAKCPGNHIVRRPGGGWALPFFSARATPSKYGFVGAGLVAFPGGDGGPWAPLAGNVSLPASASLYKVMLLKLLCRAVAPYNRLCS